MAKKISGQTKILSGTERRPQTQRVRPVHGGHHTGHQVGVPKQSHPPIMTRGPVDTREVAPSPDQAPPDWPGSDIEWMVMQSLIRIGLRPNVDFFYQSAMLGGNQQLGGIVADFVVVDPPIAIDVEGDYWHYGMGTSTLMLAKSQATQMAALGYTPIFIDADAVMADSDWIVREALAGHDHSQVGQG